MGTWDYYSFSNDIVMDLLDVSLPERAPMIFSSDLRHDGMSLQEIISEWYILEDKDVSAVVDATLAYDSNDVNLIGVIVLLVGNYYPIPAYVLLKMIEEIDECLTLAEYREYYKERWELRRTCLVAEKDLLMTRLKIPWKILISIRDSWRRWSHKPE
jgi:hypothetical protein